MKHDSPTIYALSVDGDIQYRYVGMSAYGAEYRLKEHLRQARLGSTLPVHCWIRKNNYKVIAHILESVSSRELLADAEVKWINSLRVDGYSLLNLTNGGDGLVNPSAETKQKMRDSQLSFYASEDGIKNRQLRSCIQSAKMNHPSRKNIQSLRLIDFYQTNAGQQVREQISNSVRSLYDGNDGVKARQRSRDGGRKGAIIGHHRRWHVARNIVSSDCDLCDDAND